MMTWLSISNLKAFPNDFFPNTLNTIYVSFHLHTLFHLPISLPTLPPFPHLSCSSSFLELFLPLPLMVPSFLVSTIIPSYTHESKSLKSCVLIGTILLLYAQCFHAAFSTNSLIIMCFFSPVTSWSYLIFPWGLSIASNILCRTSLMGMNVFIQFIVESLSFFFNDSK